MNRSLRTFQFAACTLIVGGLCAALAAADDNDVRLKRLAELQRGLIGDAKVPGPATKPAADAAQKAKLEAMLQNRRTSRDATRNSYANLPDGGEVRLADLVQVTQEHGLLKMDVTPLANSTSTRFHVKGLNAVVTVNRNNSVVQQMIGPNGMLVRQTVSSASITRVDLGVTNDTDIWSASANTNGNYVSFSGTTIQGMVTISQNSAARQAALGGVVPMAANVQPINVYVYEYGNMPNGNGMRLNSVFRGGAKSFTELRARFPDEFRKHVVPLLTRFSDLAWMQPGAADVYSVFTDIQPDPQAVAKLDSLLPELDSDAYPVREAASTQLLELGPPAVLAALRKNPDELSNEQRAQLGRLIAAHRRRAEMATADAKQDLGFLADCLEHGDPAVRQAAKAALEKALGVTLQFDPSLSGEALTKAADAVRKKVVEQQAAAAPATQPAEGNANQPAAAPAQQLIQPRLILR